MDEIYIVVTKPFFMANGTEHARALDKCNISVFARYSDALKYFNMAVDIRKELDWYIREDISKDGADKTAVLYDKWDGKTVIELYSQIMY